MTIDYCLWYWRSWKIGFIFFRCCIEIQLGPLMVAIAWDHEEDHED